MHSPQHEMNGAYFERKAGAGEARPSPRYTSETTTSGRPRFSGRCGAELQAETSSNMSSGANLGALAPAPAPAPAPVVPAPVVPARCSKGRSRLSSCSPNFRLASLQGQPTRHQYTDITTSTTRYAGRWVYEHWPRPRVVTRIMDKHTRLRQVCGAHATCNVDNGERLQHSGALILCRYRASTRVRHIAKCLAPTVAPSVSRECASPSVVGGITWSLASPSEFNTAVQTGEGASLHVDEASTNTETQRASISCSASCAFDTVVRKTVCWLTSDRLWRAFTSFQSTWNMHCIHHSHNPCYTPSATAASVRVPQAEA